MIGTKLYKANMDATAYAELAVWCNANNATIEDHEGYFEAIAIPAPPLDGQKATAENELWRNYKKYQQTYVDAEDLTLATVCASQGSTKGAVVQAWVMQLWAQYYTVKDAISAAADANVLAAIDLTADAFGPPPYTIRELNEEASAGIK